MMGNHLRGATIPPVPDLRFGSWKKPAKSVLASALGKESSRKAARKLQRYAQSEPPKACLEQSTNLVLSPGPPEGLKSLSGQRLRLEKPW